MEAVYLAQYSSNMKKAIIILLALILLIIGISIWNRSSGKVMEEVDGGWSACRSEKGTILETEDVSTLVVEVENSSWLYNKVIVLHYKDGYKWDNLEVGQKIKFYFPRSGNQNDVEVDVYRTDIIE